MSRGAVIIANAIRIAVRNDPFPLMNLFHSFQKLGVVSGNLFHSLLFSGVQLPGFSWATFAPPLIFWFNVIPQHIVSQGVWYGTVRTSFHLTQALRG